MHKKFVAIYKQNAPKQITESTKTTDQQAEDTKGDHQRELYTCETGTGQQVA
jgi:hypothetical protein